MTAKSPRQNLMVALGISAIDVLCCALVSSILLFLILTAPTKKIDESVSGGSEPTIRIFVAVSSDVPDVPIIRVLVYPGSEADVLPVEFWASNMSQVARPTSAIKLGDVSSLYRDGGDAWWIPSQLPAKGEAQMPSSMLAVRKPKIGNWKIQLEYAAYNPSGSIPARVEVRVTAVNLSSSSCPRAEQKFDLRIWGSVLAADSMPNPPGGTCALSNVIKVEPTSEDG
jgi:hypothetical protein